MPWLGPLYPGLPIYLCFFQVSIYPMNRYCCLLGGKPNNKMSKFQRQRGSDTLFGWFSLMIYEVKLRFVKHCCLCISANE